MVGRCCHCATLARSPALVAQWPAPGTAKLATNASGWLTGTNLVSQIGKDALYKAFVSPPAQPNEIVPWLYHHPHLMLIPSLLTLVVECGAPLALVDRRLGWLWSFGAWCMHRRW